jgi:putative aldouronate transport system substrate-binding protein
MTQKKNNILVQAIICLTLLSGCGSSQGGEISLPDFPEASPDSDSWTQWKDYDDEEITVSWYVDYPEYYSNSMSLVSQKIKEITGINIEWQTPSTSDGSKLSTMISGDKLTDLVTIAANLPTRIQLAEDGSYLYSITDLAEKWAPSLNARLDPELISYYKSSDEKLYGIPSLFYGYDDLMEMQDINSTYNSNGGIVARKDMLDAYHEYKFGIDANWDPAEATRPQGLLEMCLWVKDHYDLDNSNPTVAIAPFESQRTHGSLGIRWLMEYFSALQEDAEGNFMYQWDTPEFKEMMLWLNELYRNGLMTSGNMTATVAQVGTYIQNGYPFIFIGSPQIYTNNFRNWISRNPNGEDARYVPIIFSNSEGTVPQLAITGNSYMYTMVSQNCRRPDRVIKLLDFLYSEAGQRLITYGIESSGPTDDDGTFYYVVQPGGTAKLEDGRDHIFKYGLIDYTNTVKDAMNNLDTAGYGFFTPSVSQNGAYPYLSSVTHGMLYSYNNYLLYNLKAALKPYSYIYRPFEFELDPLDPDYLTAANIEANMRLLWMEYYAEIICAKTESIAEGMIDDTLASAYRRGLETLIVAKDRSFQKHKLAYGFDFASPINDPNNEYYQSLVITSIYGDPSLEKEIPAHIIRK